MTEPATTMPRMSPHCIFAGVPPSRWPTLRSWSISPATALEMQTTAATPSTAATPDMRVRRRWRPSDSAAMSKVESVRPEMGLFEEPIMPTRLPETAAKKKPVMAITMAATMAAVTFPENQK